MKSGIRTSASRPRTARRSAFTMIELLVAIFIIAVLLAMLLPAVQKARESARKRSCQNNLRQFGIAMQGWNGNHGCLLPAFIGHFQQGTNIDPAEVGKVMDGTASMWRGNTWAWLLLPYLEVNWASEVDSKLAWNTSNVSHGKSAVISMFFCPSRRSPMREVSPADALTRGGDGQLLNPSAGSCIDYAGNVGIGITWLDALVNMGVNKAPTDMFDSSIKIANGPFVGALVYGASTPASAAATSDSRSFKWRGQLTHSNVTDGMSNTCFLSEKWVGTNSMGLRSTAKPWYYRGTLMAGTDHDGSAFDIRDPYGFLRRGVSDFQSKPDSTDINNGYRAGSTHGTGFNCLFGDGRVLIVSYAADTVTLMNLSNRMDKMPIKWELVDSN